MKIIITTATIIIIIIIIINNNFLRITALKFSTFENYSLDVYFLSITAIKVSKFTDIGHNIKVYHFGG